MSNNLDPLSNSLNIQTIKEIDNLDLPTMQKHHVRILAHCLQILKNIDNSFEYQNKNLLREWCDNQSKRFDDKKFSDLFYLQLESTATFVSFFCSVRGIPNLSKVSRSLGSTSSKLEIFSFCLGAE